LHLISAALSHLTMHLSSSFGFYYRYVIEPLLSHICLICEAGFVGGIPVACGRGVINDLFSERDHAPAMALYFVGLLIGLFHGLPPWHKFTLIL
jgi:hypothetical protein